MSRAKRLQSAAVKKRPIASVVLRNYDGKSLAKLTQPAPGLKSSVQEKRLYRSPTAQSSADFYRSINLRQRMQPDRSLDNILVDIPKVQSIQNIVQININSSNNLPNNLFGPHEDFTSGDS